MTVVDELTGFVAADERHGVRVEVRITGDIDGVSYSGVNAFAHRVCGDALRQVRTVKADRESEGPPAPVVVPEVIEQRRLDDGSVYRVLTVEGVDPTTGKPKTYKAIEATGAVMLDGQLISRRHRHWPDGEPVFEMRPRRPTDIYHSPLVGVTGRATPWGPLVEDAPRTIAPDELDAEMHAALRRRQESDPVEQLRRRRIREAADSERHRQATEERKRTEKFVEAAEEAMRRAAQAVATSAWGQPGFTRPPAKKFENPPADWTPPVTPV